MFHVTHLSGVDIVASLRPTQSSVAATTFGAHGSDSLFTTYG